MERNAHYAAVGLTTLVLVTGLVLFVVWLARFQFANDYDLYDVQFYGPVRGLSEGGEVHFNGIKIGEVTDLRLDPRNPNRVIARVRTDSDVPVKTDSRAQLEPLGITGVNYIQITSGTPGAPLLKSRYRDDQVPVLQSQPSQITELLEGGGTVLARALETLNRVNAVLSDENIESFSNTLNNVEEVSAELAARKQLLAEAERALTEAADAAAEIKALAASSRGLVEGDAARTIQSADRAAREIEAAAADVRRLTNALQGPTTEFATTGLPQLTAAVASLQEATESVQQLVDQAQASPQSLIAKPPAREIEVPQ